MSAQRYPSAVRNATFTGDDNPGPRPVGVNLTVVLNVTAVPGTDTVTPSIEGKDPNGVYYPVLTGTAMAATGTQVLYVGDGLPATANVSANAPIPPTYRVKVTHSAGSNFTYSVSAAES